MGLQMAQAMRDRMRLSDCIVGYISEDSQMPRWGQLGCNGFIVIDGTPEQNIISKCTSAFMQVRTLAFQHVDVILNSLLNNQPVPSVCPGQFVTLNGLKAVELNGQVGVCVGAPTASDRGRVPVQLMTSGRKVAIRLNNLIVKDAMDMDDEDDECGESAGG